MRLRLIHGLPCPHAFCRRARENANGLIGANLIGANLIGANLIGANLIGANLIGANLIGANLIGANSHKKIEATLNV
jgi:uncharacterized protein YjbI with pentapeptide repeats